MKEWKTKEQFSAVFTERLQQLYGCNIAQADRVELFLTLGAMVREQAMCRWEQSRHCISVKQKKQLYYFSMEFLMGRMLTNNLMNLGVYDLVQGALEELGVDLNELEDVESDAGLGNGGLGRLAACFLDSLATLGYAGHGNCIRYEYGLFRQQIQDCRQIERPDLWLKNGNVWEVCRPQQAVRVDYGGSAAFFMDETGAHVRYSPAFSVRAVPYDMPVVGKDTLQTNTLRLWSAQPLEDGCTASDLSRYLQAVREICQNVYPDDSTEHGKKLRLKQQYFFVSAGLQAIVAAHQKQYGNLDGLAKKVAIQLNDTHPVLCIPELMRLLLDIHGYAWEQAWDIVVGVMAYTNHTVMNEALEKWPVSYMQELLPRIYMIVEEIDRRFAQWVWETSHEHELVERTRIIQNGVVCMAHLAIVGSHSVNGVAAIHTKILQEEVLSDFYRLYPQRFSNKTNGITHRRWLLYANPQLSALLKETIGADFVKTPQKLQALRAFAQDPVLQQKFREVKETRKRLLAAYVQRTQGIMVDPTSIFDVQAKRLHAYKRQLMNILNVIDLYLRIKDDPQFSIYPRTFFFAAKAAPAYAFAKEVIHLINRVADIVNSDPQVSSQMKVVFLANYGVSIAQLLVCAADVSQQISTAGTEGSGTSNMKFMMNGALTFGTRDGANIEIAERTTDAHALIFGMDRAQVKECRKQYRSRSIYEERPDIRRLLDALVDGTLQERFPLIYQALLERNDEYLVLADWDAYRTASRRIDTLYADQNSWAETCLINIAESGYFSSDRTIQEYASSIWQLEAD